MISGIELAEKIQMLKPDIRVLYMSGYTDRAIRLQERLSEGAAFIQKPFTPNLLATAVREVLGTIELDPASSEQANTIVQATRFFDRATDGLRQSILSYPQLEGAQSSNANSATSSPSPSSWRAISCASTKWRRRRIRALP